MTQEPKACIASADGYCIKREDDYCEPSKCKEEGYLKHAIYLASTL